MKATILALLCLASGSLSLASDYSKNWLDVSSARPLDITVSAPTVTLSAVCDGILNFAGRRQEYDELQCVVAFLPGFGTTWTGSMVAKGTTYRLTIKDHENRKELLIAAQDSAAIFVATNGQTKKDPVLAAAMKLYDQAGGAELSDIEKAELIINAPEYF